ncbi:uncharacterized protein [Battus philenor]
MCVACLIMKRISTDDEARLALLLQKFSREWSLLTSVTWDSVGGAFADAVYGGYVIITFGLILARVFREIPRGRRILEGIFLGFGLLFFLILGGLELASLDSIPRNLIVNASVLGSFSLVVAALFLLDLMGPRSYYATHHSQTDPITSPKPEKKVSIVTPPTVNGNLANGKSNGHVPERPKDLDLEKGKKEEQTKREELSNKDETDLFDEPKIDFIKYNDGIEKELEKSKFGSVRNGVGNGNYIKMSDPLTEPERLHYEKELAKFNERYFREFLDKMEGKLSVKEDYLPELQTPVFSKVKTGRLKSLYDDVSSTYEQKRQSTSPSRAKIVTTPTLQQLEDYLRGSTRSRRSETPALFPMEPIEERDREGPELEGRASGTPTDPGYVQYTAGRWPDTRQVRTPRHSPT